MAKKSMIARELKRTKLVAKQAEKRKALKNALLHRRSSTSCHATAARHGSVHAAR
jgi:hypothetical protein